MVAAQRDRAPLAQLLRGRQARACRSALAVKTGGADRRLSAPLNEATDENVRADLAALAGLLQRIDDWIAAGVLNGES